MPPCPHSRSRVARNCDTNVGLLRDWVVSNLSGNVVAVVVVGGGGALAGAHVVALLESFLSARDGAAVTLANVHRLDKETSGVLVLSKNSAAARVLGKEFKGRRVDKTYWAALYGNMVPPALARAAIWL